jgi:hypothetical protein
MTSSPFCEDEPILLFSALQNVHIVLYGCEKCSLTLRDVLKFHMLKNRVLRKMFKPEKDEVRNLGYYI